MKAKLVGLVFLVFMDIGFIINFHKYNLANRLLCSAFFIATVLLIAVIWKARKAEKEKRQKFIEDNQLAIQTIRNGVIPRLENSSLILQKGEFSSFECPTYMSIIKNKLVGSTGSGGGVSVRVTRGVYLRSGSSASRKIYKDITEKFYGKLIITNKRIVFLNTEKGFEIPIEKLTSVCSSRNTLSLQSQSKGYSIFLSMPNVIEELIKAIARQQ